MKERRETFISWLRNCHLFGKCCHEVKIMWDSFISWQATHAGHGNLQTGTYRSFSLKNSTTRRTTSGRLRVMVWFSPLKDRKMERVLFVRKA